MTLTHPIVSLQLNGTTWPLLLGRLDSRTANQRQANGEIFLKSRYKIK